jgi:hypothetical protein
MSAMMSIIWITLLIDCLIVMHKYLTITPTTTPANPVSNEIIPVAGIMEEPREENHSEIIKNDIKTANLDAQKNGFLTGFYKSYILPYARPIKRFVKYSVATIIFLVLAMTYESYLLPNKSIDLVVAIIGGVISGFVIIFFQKGMGE